MGIDTRKSNPHGGVKPPTRYYTMPNRIFVVNLGQGGYYSRDVRWRGVTLDKATWLSLTDANAIAANLKKPEMGYGATVEPLPISMYPCKGRLLLAW